jgi:hypothetical protein
MAKSLDEKFPHPLDSVVYRHFPNGSLDDLDRKTLSTILWIIKWSDGFNEVYSFEIARRAIANFGSLFHFDENEVVWTIIRLLEKEILSSKYLGPAEDLPLHTSIIPAIKSVKVNSGELVIDAMDYDVHKDGIIAISTHRLRLRAQKNVPLPNSSFLHDVRIVPNSTTKQSGQSSNKERCKK